MIKLLLKLLLSALIANAAWRLGSAYLTFYRFKDAVTASAQYGGQMSPEKIEQRVIELASQYDVPLAQDGFTVRRVENHTIVDGRYLQPVELLPGYQYPWRFAWLVDVFTVAPP